MMIQKKKSFTFCQGVKISMFINFLLKKTQLFVIPLVHLYTFTLFTIYRNLNMTWYSLCDN